MGTGWDSVRLSFGSARAKRSCGFWDVISPPHQAREMRSQDSESASVLLSKALDTFLYYFSRGSEIIIWNYMKSYEMLKLIATKSLLHETIQPAHTKESYIYIYNTYVHIFTYAIFMFFICMERFTGLLF